MNKKKCEKCGGDKEIIKLLPSTKRDLKEFNQLEAQGWVINHAIKIEGYINDIILHYFNPQNPDIFLSHVLNSSIMNYGGKLKTLNAILGYSKEDNRIISTLRDIGNIRNSFAHTNISHRMNINFGNAEQEGKVWVNDIMNVMNSAGKITSKDPFEFMTLFLTKYKEVEPILRKKLNELRGLQPKSKKSK